MVNIYLWMRKRTLLPLFFVIDISSLNFFLKITSSKEGISLGEKLVVLSAFQEILKLKYGEAQVFIKASQNNEEQFLLYWLFTKKDNIIPLFFQKNEVEMIFRLNLCP